MLKPKIPQKIVSLTSKPPVHWTDYLCVVLLWVGVFIVFGLVWHSYHVFNLYYHDTERLIMYDDANDPRTIENCKQTTAQEMKRVCKKYERWVYFPYIFNIFNDVLDEHADHFRHSPEFPSLLGTWGHFQIMKIIDSIVGLFQTLTSSVLWSVVFAVGIVVVAIYLFYHGPIRHTTNLHERLVFDQIQYQQLLQANIQNMMGQPSTFGQGHKVRSTPYEPLSLAPPNVNEI